MEDETCAGLRVTTHWGGAGDGLDGCTYQGLKCCVVRRGCGKFEFFSACQETKNRMQTLWGYNWNTVMAPFGKYNICLILLITFLLTLKTFYLKTGWHEIHDFHQFFNIHHEFLRLIGKRPELQTNSGFTFKTLWRTAWNPSWAGWDGSGY